MGWQSWRLPMNIETAAVDMKSAEACKPTSSKHTFGAVNTGRDLAILKVEGPSRELGTIVERATVHKYGVRDV
jgi:hypothetical protein